MLFFPIDQWLPAGTTYGDQMLSSEDNLPHSGPQFISSFSNLTLPYFGAKEDILYVRSENIQCASIGLWTICLLYPISGGQPLLAPYKKLVYTKFSRAIPIIFVRFSGSKFSRLINNFVNLIISKKY